MTTFVFDTNIVSWLIIHDPTVTARMNQRVSAQDKVIGCPFVFFESQRGLLAKDAKHKMQQFSQVFAAFEWQDYTREDWSLAAQWWVERRRMGSPISDSDLLIAAFARNRSATLVTDNTRDFSGLDLSIENWR